MTRARTESGPGPRRRPASRARTRRSPGSRAGPGSAPAPWYCGEPTIMPLRVSAVASSARAIPKSITRGPSGASSTLDGLRSRCTTPAAWMACRASATPAISRNTIASGIGPFAADRLLQRRARHVGGHQPRRRGVRIGVEQLRGVQPVHPPGGLDLLPEAGPEVPVVAQVRPHHLERDAAARRAWTPGRPGPSRRRRAARAAGSRRSRRDHRWPTAAQTPNLTPSRRGDPESGPGARLRSINWVWPVSWPRSVRGCGRRGARAGARALSRGRIRTSRTASSAGSSCRRGRSPPRCSRPGRRSTSW